MTKETHPPTAKAREMQIEVWTLCGVCTGTGYKERVKRWPGTYVDIACECATSLYPGHVKGLVPLDALAEALWRAMERMNDDNGTGTDDAVGFRPRH